MPLIFKHLCDLLSDLESHATRRPPWPPARREKLFQDTITRWFHTHEISLDSPHVDPVVLLSALLPARRTDRVYNLQAPSLSRRLRRVLCLGAGRWQQLDEWKTPGRGDLGECVERLQREAEFPIPRAAHEVTLEEIDKILASIASSCRFSAPNVRDAAPSDSPGGLLDSLQRIYHRLQSREAKWFTRMILKDYPSLELKESVIFRALDTRLPAMMRNQDSFESAISSLRNQKTVTPADEDGGARPSVMDPSRPKIGVKVGRPTYLKGRSVKQVVNIINGRLMSVERKYDGEYCQIHVDLSKGDRSIQIFSKSGKDSTRDREKLHAAIRQSLRIGNEDCGFATACILEGEMVVWSDKENKIMPFSKLRKHVNRSGSFIGTALDSQMDDSEHLMIVFYDVLLVDDDPVLKKPYSYRRTTMERLVKCIKGTAKLTTRKEIRFASREGPRQLQNLLACAFARQWEGVVLKPMNDPYFRASEKSSHEFASCWIKMKKDYIPGLGDTADFAIVGAGYSAKEAAVKPIPNLRWTHFYVGCLRNKSEVVGFGAKPRFTVVDRVNQSLTSDDLIAVNRLSQFRAMDINSPEVSETFTLDYQSNMSDMAVAFKEPFVFELLGAGFDKLPNQNLFTLRFPRVQKVHWDRDWKDAVSLDELQEMAWQVQSAPGDDDLKDIKAWMHRIDQAERGTKGSMLPWDDSQEQKEARRYSPTGPTKSRRRNKSLVSPPMIRTDTAEMSDKEQRPDRARVAEGFDSEHSSTSGMGNDTPPTSPISSPLPSPAPVKTLGKISPPTPSRPGDRKRPASSEGPDLSRMFKKSKTDVDRTTLKQGEQAPTIPQPLNDVTNSAFPRQSLSSSSTSSKFSLFPEGVTSSNDLLDRGSKRRSESSSLAHDTIDSGNSSHPPASLPKYKSSETMRAIRIPDVSKWTVLLSSCVAELPYSLVIEILHNRSLTQPKTAFRLPSPGYNSGPVLYPESCHDQRLLVLVDESHEEATSEAMKQVIAFMPLWRPAEVQVWDWRFSKVWREEEVEVEEDVHDENDDMMKLPERRLRAKKHFLAKVVPIGEKGGIEIQWRTGNPTRIPPRSLRRR